METTTRLYFPILANPQTLNRYSYVGNNPIRFTDPSGHVRQNCPDIDGCPEPIPDTGPPPLPDSSGGNPPNDSLSNFGGDLRATPEKIYWSQYTDIGAGQWARHPNKIQNMIHSWLSNNQFAIAVGQFTPGPVLSTATFIGWQLNGLWGAIAATVGIFLPSFLFVALLNPLIPKLRRSQIMSAFLDAVNIAAVAVIVAVCIEMGKDTLTDWRTIFIAFTSLIVVFGYKKLNSAFVVIGGAILGYFLTLI